MGTEERDVLGEIMEKIEYTFNDTELLLRALTHKSFANENIHEKDDNQRLEFLGDAVLGLVVAEALMERLPTEPEGILTQSRAALGVKCIELEEGDVVSSVTVVAGEDSEPEES